MSIVYTLGDHNNWTRMRNYIWLAHKYNIMVGNGNTYFLSCNGAARAELLAVIDKVLGDSGEGNG